MSDALTPLLSPEDVASFGWRIVAPVRSQEVALLDRLDPAGDLSTAWFELEQVIDDDQAWNTEEPHRALVRVIMTATGPVIRPSFTIPPGGERLPSVAVEFPTVKVEAALRSRVVGDKWLAGLEAALGEEVTEPFRAPARDGKPLGIDFYRRVAARYLRLSALGQPVRQLADEAGVSHATAQRWIVDARKRKLLPPAARQGKGL